MVSGAVTALLLVGCGALLAEAAWTDLRVNSKSANLRVNNFYRQLPRTAGDATELGWVSPPEESRDSLSCQVPYTVLCPTNDPTLCLIYDKKGFIAGAEFGVVAYNAASAYPYAKKSSFTSKKRFGFDSYIATVFIVDQSVLNDGRSTLSSTGTGVWLQNGRNSMITVPLNEADANATTSSFVKQTCSSGVGIQYQYNLATTSLCEDAQPIVALYHAGELVGFAFQAFGQTTFKGQQWTDTTSTAEFTASLDTTAPACMSEWATTYGLVSVHLFFTPTPWLTCC